MRALLVLLAACGGAQSVATPPPPALVVRTAGTGPQRIVKIELTQGASERAESHVDMSFTTTTTNTILATGTKMVTLPTITLRERWQVIETLPDGSARVRIENERVTAESDIPDAKVQAMLDRILEHLRRRHDTFRLQPDGTRTDVQIDDGRAHTPENAGAEADNDVVFPPTPIGVGAEWSVTRSSTRQGVQWQDTRTYRLRALDDNTASVELEISAESPPQAVAVSPTASTKLTVGKITQTGQFVIPLHGLVPTGGSHFDAQLSFQLVRKDLRIETSTHIQRAEQIQPAPAD